MASVLHGTARTTPACGTWNLRAYEVIALHISSTDFD
jgi:hypothetical protein